MIDDGARERIYIAVESLVGGGPIKDRLKIAALSLFPLQPGKFPPGEQRELFEQIYADLTKLSGGQGGDLGTTLHNMDDATAVQVAESIVRLLYISTLSP